MSKKYTINERFRKLRDSLGLSQAKFGDSINVSRGAINAIEQNRSNVHGAILKAICLEYHVNESWLVDGTGEMFIDCAAPSPRQLLEDYLLEKYKELPPAAQKEIYNFAKKIIEEHKAE